MGYIATLTSRNTQGIDILVSDTMGKNPIAIQVKTTAGKTLPRDWILSNKSEELESKNLFYVFVNLRVNANMPPEYFIVPSKDVAEYIRETHREWLNTPGRGGKKHNDSDVRMFRDREGKYLNRWNLLGL
jgi:hypothetical protein